MNSQQLDTRIDIDRVTITKGGSGGMAKAWAPHAQVWARRLDYAGTERQASSAGGVVATARVEFVLRLRSDLDETMRVRHQGKVYNIQHIKPLANDRGWTVLTCDTGVNDG